MDPTDKELKEQLSQGPLVRNGFDDRLRKRIEDNLERPQRRGGRAFRASWSFAGAAALAILIVLAGVWHWSSGDASHSGKKEASLAGPEGTNAAMEAATDPDIHSALLLGLRKDVAAPDGSLVSSYRTILVAPENNRLKIAAEGPGIVMPYKQTFWKLEATEDDGTNEAQSLIAYQTYGSKALTERPDNTVANPRKGLLSERILYVGKEYVSVALDAGSGSGEEEREYRFVKTIKQLAQSEGTNFEAAREPHTSLEAVMNGTAQPTDGSSTTEQWAIVRKPGQWVGVTYGSAAGLGPIDGNAETELATTMPNDVVPEDRLLLDWKQIRSINPAASDAYTYQDLLATVADREITVYPYKQKDGLKHPLSLELDPDESIVMVEWALNQSETKNYADQWKVKVSEILSQNQ